MPKHLTTSDTADFVTAAQVGAVNGIAQLGSDGKVPTAQLPPSAAGAVLSVNGHIGNVTLAAADVDAVGNAAKGAANGVAQLDSGSHLPVGQLPASVVVSSQVGAVNGIATLDGSGKLSASQAPAAAVASVNTRTGAVTLAAADVGALATSARAAANGVASLDSSSKVPVAQIPSLLSQYQPVPGATPAEAGDVLTAVTGGSNSAQWSAPLAYTAVSPGTMPSGVPSGSLCTRTDTKSLYEYVSGAWVLLPYVEPWRVLTLVSTVRGFQNNLPMWLPKIRRVGSQVFVRGRMELKAGGSFPAAADMAVITLPSDCIPAASGELTGTASTSGSQGGYARFQVNSPLDATDPGTITLWTGNGPTPSTTWVGVQGSYWLD